MKWNEFQSSSMRQIFFIAFSVRTIVRNWSHAYSSIWGKAIHYFYFCRRLLLLLLFVVFFCNFGTHCQHVRRVYELCDYKDDDARAIQFTFLRVSRCKNNKRVRFQNENSNESAIKSSKSERPSVVERKDTPNKCRTRADRRRAQCLKTLLWNKCRKGSPTLLTYLKRTSEWIGSDDEWVPQRAE